MKIRICLFITFLSLVLFSCSKDNSVSKPNNQQNNSYQPTSAGSSWYYKDNINTNGNFTLIATGVDTTINGVQFAIFQNKPDSTSQIYPTFFGQSQVSYYALGFVNAFGDIPILYLKDTALNSTWKQIISVNVPQLGGQTEAELDFDLTQSGITYSLNGKSYSNVAHVTLNVKVEIPGLGTTNSGVTGDIYFARGIGIISVVVQNQGSKVEDVSLLNYTIK